MAQNPAKMMKQMQKLQEDMAAAQQRLAEETVSASAGGGAVTVTVTGALEFADVQISPEALDDVELLQDTIVAAANEAMRKAQVLANERMGAIAGALGNMGIPGL
jgi:DNA-binding YbaB/EbfC family protein